MSCLRRQTSDPVHLHNSVQSPRSVALSFSHQRDSRSRSQNLRVSPDSQSSTKPSSSTGLSYQLVSFDSQRISGFQRLDWRVQRVRHVAVNPVDAIFVESCAESACYCLIIGKIFPSPRVNPSNGHIVHCSLTSRTNSFWGYTGEGFESHVNYPCRRLYIAASYWCGRFRVDDCPGWCFDLNG